MDKYELVEEVRQNEEIGENEVRIQQQGKPRKYISYAVGLLTVSALQTARVALVLRLCCVCCGVKMRRELGLRWCWGEGGLGLCLRVV